MSKQLRRDARNPFTAIFHGPLIGLPIVGDAEQADQRFQELEGRIVDIADDAVKDRLTTALSESGVEQVLKAVFSNSPFLSQCVLSDPAFLDLLLEQGPDTGLSAVIDEVKDNLHREPDRAIVMRGLRVARKRVALLVALADITGLWSLERVTQSLSDFADVATSATLSHLLLAAEGKGEIALVDDYFPEFECGCFALAMGKYGARELNYSSDIDLIVLYDPAKISYHGRRSAQQLMIRVTRDLVSILQEMTADGYVFRVDLRLRPDPGSTPVAIPYASALKYYETRGAGWERAAMVKARPAIGDLRLGAQFMAELEPFIWRPAIDFWAQREIAKIKQHMNEHRGSTGIDFLGQNIKVGRGGIREIEFFAQSHQLVYGGRDAYHRSARTLDALSTLAESNVVSDKTADELTEAYEFLRQLEHRLQMISDQQTQTLPNDETGMRHVAHFMGYEELSDFRDTVLHHLGVVQGAYSAAMALGDQRPGDPVLDMGSGDEVVGKLRDLGFEEPAATGERILKWQSGAYQAIRDPRAQEVIAELTPRIIDVAVRGPTPDYLLERFDDFLKSLKSGLRCLSTINAQEQAFDFVIGAVTTAPALVGELCRWPERIQALLSETDLDHLSDPRFLAADCARVGNAADGMENRYQTIAAWANELRFRVASKVVDHGINWLENGHALTAIADAVIQTLTGPHLAGGSSEGDGNAPSLAFVALGPYGERRLAHGAPADLLVLHHNATDTAVKTARRLFTHLAAANAEGQALTLNVDATPYGTGRAILSEIEPFFDYCRAAPDPRALLSLCRMRVVCGADDVTADFGAALDDLFAGGGAWRALSSKARDFHAAYCAAETSGVWDVRRCAGGLEQLDGVLSWFKIKHPELRSLAVEEGVKALVDAGEIIEERSRALIEARQVLGQVEAFLAVASGTALGRKIEPPLAAALTRACGSPDFDDLETRLQNAKATVRATFDDVFAGSCS